MTKSGFMNLMTSKSKDVSSEQGIIEAFQVFDKDGKGLCLIIFSFTI